MCVSLLMMNVLSVRRIFDLEVTFSSVEGGEKGQDRDIVE